MVSITWAYPATSCSSRVRNDSVSSPLKRFSTSRSLSLAPSIRVEEPMLSMVATRLSDRSRSGLMLSTARHSPLNSSIDAIRRSISLEGWMWGGSMAHSKHTSISIHFHPFPSISIHFHPFLRYFHPILVLRGIWDIMSGGNCQRRRQAMRLRSLGLAVRNPKHAHGWSSGHPSDDANGTHQKKCDLNIAHSYHL